MKYSFEELPLQPPNSIGDPTDFLVYAIVEQEEGSTERTVWDEAKREFVKTGLVMKKPLPAPYGWIPQTFCEGDGDALDVLILTETKIPQGHYLATRPVGVLLRRDQDHKVLAVDLQDTRFGAIQNYTEVPPELLTFIEDWFRPYFELDGWLDAIATRQIIAQSHALFHLK
ncbi:MAG: inorganic diphosphatase [Chloroflexota bacterium]|nr:inorganic diphosphatase [Chloroflexota bacterium]